MPYSKEHKRQVRKHITESARILFNRHGFETVTIDQIMEHAGLTRGGFYNHFSSKEALYKEAVMGFLMQRGQQWRDEAGINMQKLDPNAAINMIKSYLSRDHLQDLDGQCPMIALPSDIARANDEVKAAYQKLLEAMVYLFQTSLAGKHDDPDQQDMTRQQALALAATCVGGMVLSRTLPDSRLAEEVQSAAQEMALSLCE